MSNNRIDETVLAIKNAELEYFNIYNRRNLQQNTNIK